MKKRIGVIVGLLLAAVAALLLLRIPRQREPVFEGRTLTSWLHHHVPASDAIPPYNSPGWKKADHAIQAIGTNAIPTLLKMIQAKDLPLPLLKVLAQAQRHGLTRFNYPYAEPRQREAEYAFRMLGTNAASAVPELIRIYRANISPSSQMYAALSLANIGPPARAALPSLIANFTHTKRDVRFYAVTTVMSLGGQPDLVIPALTSVLKDPDVGVRWNALVGLSSFGGRARPVASDIMEMLNDPGIVGGSSITQEVETALWRIAPEKVGKPFVVEDATPMITNGLTSQALKLMFLGKRRTLIPPGRRIPAVAQYWNNDPWPMLTLYRGVSSSDDSDQLLGHFEVSDFPSRESRNVSTLCVVADGKIFLCARDNNRETFLEIRRVEGDAAK